MIWRNLFQNTEICMRYASYASGANPPGCTGEAPSLWPPLWDPTPGHRWCPERQLTRAWRLTCPGCWDSRFFWCFFGTLHPVRYLTNYSLTQWELGIVLSCSIMIVLSCVCHWVCHFWYHLKLILWHLVTLCGVYTLRGFEESVYLLTKHWLSQKVTEGNAKRDVKGQLGVYGWKAVVLSHSS